MAYSKKVVEKFENTLNEPEKTVLEDGIPLIWISEQVWLVLQLAVT